GRPGEADGLVAGDRQVDVFEVVLARPPDHDLGVLQRLIAGGVLVSHRRGPSSGWSSACATCPTRRRPPAAGPPGTPSRRDEARRAGRAVPPPARTAGREPLSSSGARDPCSAAPCRPAV